MGRLLIVTTQPFHRTVVLISTRPEPYRGLSTCKAVWSIWLSPTGYIGVRQAG